jgi:hypothetical protein
MTPHDPESRYCRKITAGGQREWIGYRDPQTEARRSVRLPFRYRVADVPPLLRFAWMTCFANRAHNPEAAPSVRRSPTPLRFSGAGPLPPTGATGRGSESALGARERTAATSARDVLAPTPKRLRSGRIRTRSERADLTAGGWLGRRSYGLPCGADGLQKPGPTSAQPMSSSGPTASKAALPKCPAGGVVLGQPELASGPKAGRLRRRRPHAPHPRDQAEAEEDPVPTPPGRRLSATHRSDHGPRRDQTAGLREFNLSTSQVREAGSCRAANADRNIARLRYRSPLLGACSPWIEVPDDLVVGATPARRPGERRWGSWSRRQR